MAIHCTSVPYFTCRHSKEIPSSLCLSSFARFPATQKVVDSTKFKLSAPRFPFLVSSLHKSEVNPNSWPNCFNRLRTVISALVSDKKNVESNYSGINTFRLTYLEVHFLSWYSCILPLLLLSPFYGTFQILRTTKIGSKEWVLLFKSHECFV